ncbi:MAG TPA: hypothetical protein PLJ44_04855, partial [Victivallales bacterium]|nr:hypothetical protein [Victivallales bacterium]
LIISSAVVLLVTLVMGGLMSEFSLFVLQDIAVIVNICFAMFFSLVIADNISSKVSNPKNKSSYGDPFALMSLIWEQILSGALSFISYFSFSSLVFLLINYFFSGGSQFALLNMLILSYLAYLPLSAIAASLSIWIRNKVSLYLIISAFIFISIVFSSKLSLINKIFIPDMDFYQVNTLLLHGVYGSFLYIFSVFGLGLLWILALGSFSILLYVIVKRYNRIPIFSMHMLIQFFIFFTSAFLVFYISGTLRSIELEQKEKIADKVIIPRTGFRGLWADFNFLLLCSIPNKEHNWGKYYSKDDIKKIYTECIINKPSFDSLSKNLPFILANINFLPAKEINSLIYDSIHSYLKNPYLKREALFEFNASSLLISQSNPERKKYLLWVAELLRQTQQIAPPENKDIIFKQIVSINTELIQNASWERDLIPLNKDFAELLAWYREWKIALAISSLQNNYDIDSIEKKLLRAADKTENTCKDNPNIISSVKEIKKKVYMAKYISKDILPFIID